jgi:hypothetical protein
MKNRGLRTLFVIGILLSFAFFVGFYPVFHGPLLLKDIWGSFFGSVIGFIFVIAARNYEKHLDRVEARERRKEETIRFANQYFFVLRFLQRQIRSLPDNSQRPKTPFEISSLNSVRNLAFSMLGIEYGHMAEYSYAALSDLNLTIVALNEFDTENRGKLNSTSVSDNTKETLDNAYRHYLVQFLASERPLGDLQRHFESEFKTTLRMDFKIKI